jgi:hypothetical protein
MDNEFVLPAPKYQYLVPGTVGRSRQLTDFQYRETSGLSEEHVKAVVACLLRGAGYTVEVGRQGARGPDLVAESDSGRIIVEAKGEGRNPRAIYRSFMVVLGQILRRMQNEDSRFVIALPAQEELSSTYEHCLRL